MTDFNPENPLIVQGDHTVLIEVDNPLYPDARDALARFAELLKSSEHIHTYRISPLSIWNACAPERKRCSLILQTTENENLRLRLDRHSGVHPRLG